MAKAGTDAADIDLDVTSDDDANVVVVDPNDQKDAQDDASVKDDASTASGTANRQLPSNWMFGIVEDAYESDSDSDSDDTQQNAVPSSPALQGLKPFNFENDISLYAPRSLFLFTIDNPIRKFCFRVVHNPYFEYAIFALLVITAVFNILAANTDASDLEIKLNDDVSLVILILFTIEALMRIIAAGFMVGKLSYLRDPWNVFDMIVVIAGWIDVGTPEFNGIYAIRLLRIMRVVRIIRMVPKMRELVRGILQSIPALAYTGGLFVLVFFVCAIVGVKLFKGSYRGRCFTEDGDVVDDSRVCSLNSLYGYHCNSTLKESCKDYGNPNYGFTNFDNFAWSQLTVFQILTVEGWTDDLYYSQDGNIRGVTWIYFVVVVVVGSFFLLNLVTAVLCDKIGESISVKIPHIFSTNNLQAVANDENDQQKLASQRSVANAFSGTSPTDPGDASSQAAGSQTPTQESARARAIRRRSAFLRPEASVRFLPVTRTKSSHSIAFASANNALEFTNTPGASGGPSDSSPSTSAPSSPIASPPSAPTSPTSPSSTLAAPTSAPTSPSSPLVAPTSAPSSPNITKKDDSAPSSPATSPRSGSPSLIPSGSTAHLIQHTPPDSPSGRRRKHQHHHRIGSKDKSPPIRMDLDPPQQQPPPVAPSPTPAAMLAGMFSGLFADVYTNYFPETFKQKVTFVDRVIRPRVNAVLSSFWFETLVCLIVLIHTIILATQSYRMSESRKEAVFVIDRIFIALFTAEVIFRVFGAGLKGYFAQTKVNWLDVIVLIGCWIEVGLVATDVLDRGKYISVFRLFRVFELLRRSQAFANSAESIIACIKIAANPALLLILFIYLYAMVGVSIFGEESHFPQDTGLTGRPRQNFDNFLHAALCVFQVLTGENWNNLLYTGMRYTYGAVPFFVSMYILGRYVLLAFFLAVMVDVYAETNPVILQRKLFGILSKYKNKKLSKNFTKFVTKFKHAGGPTTTSAPGLMSRISGLPLLLTGSMSGFFKTRAEYSYWIFPPDSRIRDIVEEVIFHRYYQRLSMLMVVASCVVAALYLPHTDRPNYNSTLQHIELFFSIFFLVEVFCKGLAKNFVFGRTKYLHDVWSLLDFFVIVVSSITTFTTRYRFFVVFRGFRPLQLITNYKPVRIVLQALFFSLPSILPVFLIALVWWSMFAIFGIQLWAGTFQQCNVAGLTYTQCQGTVTDNYTGEVTTLQWENPHYNFDNFGWAMLTLFEVSTLEGWLNVMFSGMDATYPYQRPIENYRPASALFFVFFILGAVFFLLNLFMAVVTNQFFIVYEKESGLAFMDEKDREWKETKRNIKAVYAIVRPKPPEKPLFLRKIHFIVFHKYFEIAMSLLVCLNMVVFMMDHRAMSDDWKNTIFSLTLFFSLLYIVELSLKLYFYGPEAFVQSKVRCFEGIVVLVSLVVIIISFALPSSYFITFLSIFLILRVFRIVKLSRKLRILLATLWNSLWLNGAVFLVLCILLYIYAVIGIHFYADIVYGDYLNVHANFNNFAIAVLTLFRMTTGENWNGIMHDCMVQEPYCSEAEGTCGTYWAILYYVSFQMIGTFLFLPLFVAVILRQFQDENSAENFVVSPARIQEFRKVWQKFDPYGKQRIGVADLYYFLSKLPPPLGIGKHRSAAYNAIIKKLTIRPTNKGHVYFTPLLLNLGAIALGVEYVPKRTALSTNVSMVVSKSNKTMDKWAKNFKQGTHLLWFIFAVIYIQRMWRARRRKRMFLNGTLDPETVANDPYGTKQYKHKPKHSSSTSTTPSSSTSQLGKPGTPSSSPSSSTLSIHSSALKNIPKTQPSLLVLDPPTPTNGSPSSSPATTRRPGDAITGSSAPTRPAVGPRFAQPLASSAPVPAPSSKLPASSASSSAILNPNSNSNSTVSGPPRGPPPATPTRTTQPLTSSDPVIAPSSKLPASLASSPALIPLPTDTVQPSSNSNSAPRGPPPATPTRTSQPLSLSDPVLAPTSKLPASVASSPALIPLPTDVAQPSSDSAVSAPTRGPPPPTPTRTSPPPLSSSAPISKPPPSSPPPPPPTVSSQPPSNPPPPPPPASS